jgi:NADPH:quinone reductase-like Zn-dependent oxidoreductase
VGGSGGVGTFAVQIARHLGARVTGVCSTGKVDLVRGLGAEQVVDYTREDLASAGLHDLIVVTGGKRSWRELRRCLTPSGRVVLVGSGLASMGVLGGAERTIVAPFHGLRTQQSMRGFLAKANRADLETLAGLVASGDLEPAITARYGLDEVVDAMRVLGTGHATGKAIVLP